MSTYTKHVDKKQDKGLVVNSAGGMSFAVDDWKRLERFLILGSEGGSYYASERKLTRENAACVERCAKLDAQRTVDTIVTISEEGRAPKNDPAVFALALCASLKDNARCRGLALSAMPRVCRIGTHLFQFVEAVDALRGWGRALRNAVGGWYAEKKPAQLAYQAAKYQQRNGWSHRDVLRLAHPRLTGDHSAIAYWATKGWPSVGAEPHPNENLSLLWAFERAKKATTATEICTLIEQYALPRECVPTQFLNDARVWESLLDGMPLMAMVRNLGKMTSVGLLRPFSSSSRKACEALGDVNALKKARLHPLSILLALKVYQQGHGEKGGLTWSPDQNIVQALDSAFYLAFQAVEPAGKNWMLGVDVSSSMGAQIAGMPLSCCEAATALALVTTATEPYTFVGAFNAGFQRLPFSKKMRLDSALLHTRPVNFGATDCAQPMLYALANRIEVDQFVVLTDSDTWAGNVQPHTALQQYRQRMGRPAKLIVAAMTSSGFTIADPGDSGMLDVVGFDTATPALMADFARN